MPKSKVQSRKVLDKIDPDTKKVLKSMAAKPSTAQLTFESDSVRCFYCKSLLLVTDEKAFHAVCSANCPSRLVQLDAFGVRLVKRAWRFQASLNSVSKECARVSNEDSPG